MAVRFSTPGPHYVATVSYGSQSTFTMAAWIKISVDTNANTNFLVLTDASTGFATIQTTSSGLDLKYADSSVSSSSTLLTVGTWYYAAVSKSGTTGTLYVRAIDAAAWTTIAFTSAASSLTVNRFYVGENTSRTVNGCVHAAKFWMGVALPQHALDAEMWQVMPQRTDSMEGWYPLLDPESVDFSGNGSTLSSPAGLAQEAGPPIAWRQSALQRQHVFDPAGVYDPEILQVESGTATGSSITVDFTPAGLGNMLLLFVASDTTKTGDPAGWSVPTGGAQDGGMQLYTWNKVAAGGEDQVVVSLTGAASSAWTLLEVSRAPVIDVSAGQFADTSVGSYATPSASPSTGRRFAVAAVAGRRAVNQANSVIDWSSEYAELADVSQQGATSVSLAVAYRMVEVLSGVTTGAVATFANAQDNQGSFLAVLKQSAVVDAWTFGWAVQVGA